MEYLPISIRLRGEPVLLVGGGTIATRKARLLLAAGARLTVVAPDLAEELDKQLQANRGDWRQRRYRENDLDGQQLVVAATGDAATNEQVYHDARARNLPVNVVDAPEFCSFIFPSIVDRSPLTIAISSSGRSPVLARRLRRQFEAQVPAAYGRLAEFAGGMRQRVKQAISEESTRRLFWEQVIDGVIGEQVLAGNEERAGELLDEQLRDEKLRAEHDNREGNIRQGEVYLVGAGPGDPDLMTFKAMRLLQTADVVLYDRLVSTPIVEMARRDAERIYVGKRRAEHSMPQPEINQLLVDLAQQGKRVVRLKGGDPFIFGRGGEEIELLAHNKIAFQVVPGVSAANGVACYAGIPLTHRDYAQSVRFVAGHLKDGRLDHQWEQFQSRNETLVFYMGLVGLPTICAGLIGGGRAPDTPVAVVEQGTYARQRVVVGSLESINALVARQKPRAPTIIIIGDVVRLHAQLRWFGESTLPGDESRAAMDSQSSD